MSGRLWSSLLLRIKILLFCEVLPFFIVLPRSACDHTFFSAESRPQRNTKNTAKGWFPFQNWNIWCIVSGLQITTKYQFIQFRKYYSWHFGFSNERMITLFNFSEANLGQLLRRSSWQIKCDLLTDCALSSLLAGPLPRLRNQKRLEGKFS